MHVGFLGLGAIGAPMAAHLARRGPLTVWTRTVPRAAEYAARHGAGTAATPREAAAADVVITCLSTSADVASLLDGPDGLLAGLRPGALFLDCTSIPRLSASRLGRGAQVAFADAPVSGRITAPRRGRSP
jgi:3-hydroxyisobutyrate dehydrogenase-like beta-hydroxyacid dehydrogenase